jgi:sugar phosphate permease
MGFISDKLKRRKLPMIIGAMGAAILMSAILYYPNLNEHSIGILMFLLGLFYSAQTIVFAVGRELSPKEAGGTAIAMTNMIVMMGALFLQPLVGRLLDISVWARHAAPLILLKGEHLQYLYIAADYRWAMSTIPIGILVAAFLTIFIRETYAEAQV